MKVVDVPLLMASLARLLIDEPTVVCCNQAPENNGDYALFFTTGEGIQVKTNVEDYYSGTLYLAVSNQSYSVGYENIAKLLGEFDFEGRQFDNPLNAQQIVDFKLCKPDQLPVSFARNEAGNIEHMTSFTVTLSVSDKQ